MAKGTDIPKFGLLNGLKVLGCGVVTAEPYAVDMMAEQLLPTALLYGFLTSPATICFWPDRSGRSTSWSFLTLEHW